MAKSTKQPKRRSTKLQQRQLGELVKKRNPDYSNADDDEDLEECDGGRVKRLSSRRGRKKEAVE